MHDDQEHPGLSSESAPLLAGEPSQLPPRVLYGYVRVDRDDQERAAALKSDLLSFCRTYGYLLGTVFTDWGVADTAVARPGFSSLLDVCKLVGSYGVLVPTRSHLSSDDDTLTVLSRQVRRTGVQLIAVDDVTAAGLGPTGTAPGGAQPPAADGDTPC
jgi:DNA invertase Pin-like site-specific DNA recombinase